MHTLLALTLFPIQAAAPSMPDTSAFRLEDYQWKNRLVLVFAPSKKAPAYEQQMRLFEATPDSQFAERDLLVFTLLAEGESRAAGRAPSEEEAVRLRERFEVGTESFAVVLIGKDGTEKRRDAAPVEPEALFRTIDAMPMRQREMERQRNPRQ